MNLNKLTPREAQIAVQLQAGKTNKEIAKALGVSPYTVRDVLQRICEKLGCKNRVEVALSSRDLVCTQGLQVQGSHWHKGDKTILVETTKPAQGMRELSADELWAVSGGVVISCISALHASVHHHPYSWQQHQVYMP
jgi:DNA-binding CsgD family transcriptional regulator